MNAGSPVLQASRPGWDFASTGWLVLTGLAPALDEDVFWDLLDGIDWGPKASPVRAAKALVQRIAPADCAGAVVRDQALGRRLAEHLEQWEYAQGESLGLSDDAFMSLVHHLIGLGQGTYERLMRSPDLAKRFVQQGKFTAGLGRVLRRAQALYSLTELTEAIASLGRVSAFDSGLSFDDQQLVEHPGHGLGIALVRPGGTRIVFADGDLAT